MNIGAGDRRIRGGLGVFLLFIAVLIKNSLIAIAGFFVLYESISGWCAFYQLIGKNTCSLKTADKQLVIKNLYIRGMKILIVAIILNVFAGFVGWQTWYDVLRDPQHVLSWDNYLFLLLIYPIFLGLSV